MEEKYTELIQRFGGDKDSLHSAYVTLIEVPCPIGVRRGTFGHRISNSFYRQRRKERNYAAHFILPDPVFWLLQAEKEPDEPAPDDGRTAEEEQREMRGIKSFLRTMFSNEEMIIFNLAVEKDYDICDVSDITGWSTRKIDDLLDCMEIAIRDNYHKPHKHNKDSKDKA